MLHKNVKQFACPSNIMLKSKPSKSVKHLCGKVAAVQNQATVRPPARRTIDSAVRTLISSVGRGMPKR